MLIENQIFDQERALYGVCGASRTEIVSREIRGNADFFMGKLI